MLENAKKWCREKAEKGKEWLDKNKGAIGFGLGAAAMAGFYLIAEKLDEPKKAAITFDREEQYDNAVIGRVYYKNRFGKEKQVFAVDYSDDGEKDLKGICDNLNEIVYPGD